MDVWRLPDTLTVAGKKYKIRTDYRAIIDILIAFNDPDLEADEKWLTCLAIMYVDFANMPLKEYNEAATQAQLFIDMGENEKNPKKFQPRVMDWEQDAKLIIPAVNRVLNEDVRGKEYLHWWTFLSAYTEIGDCAYSQIINLRTKKAKGKKLEKWEQEFIRENSDIVTIKAKLSEAEKEEQRQLEEIF